MLLKASLVYLFCHISSVMQGILTKFATLKLNNFNEDLFAFLTLRALFVILITFPFAFKHFKLLKKNKIIIFVLTCLASLDTIFFNFSIKFNSVNLVVIIMFTVPILINILSPLILKEKSSKKDYIFLIICLIAIFIANPTLLTQNNENLTKAIIFPVATVFIVVFGLIFQKKWSNKRPIPLAIFLNGLFLLIFSLTLKKEPILLNLDLKILFFAFLVAIFDIIDFFSVYKAYQMYNLSKLQPVRFLRIIISIILSYLILKEEPTINQIIGGTVIILANFINIITNKQKEITK